MRFLIAMCLLFSGLSINAQVIEDDSQVVDKPGGEALFLLNGGEEIYSFAPENGWYKIRKEVYIDPLRVVDDKYIQAGTELKNAANQKIGEVLKEVRIKEGERLEAFRGKDRYKAIIEGYVFKTKFEDNSHPEDRISAILAMRNRNEQVGAFQDLFEKYTFEERRFEELTAWVYREQNKTLSEDKDFRIIVLFRGESTPYAIISNNHDVSAPKIKSSWEDGDFKIIYFYKPTTAQEDLIQNQIIYTFLGL